MANETDFKYIVRVADTDLTGEGKLVKTLPNVKGIGMRAGLALIRAIGLDPNKIVGVKLDKHNTEKPKAIVIDVVKTA